MRSITCTFLVLSLACPAAARAQASAPPEMLPEEAAERMLPADPGVSAGRILAEAVGGLGGLALGALGGGLLGAMVGASSGDGDTFSRVTIASLATGAVLGGATGTWLAGDALGGDGSWLATTGGMLPGALIGGAGGVLADDKTLGTLGTVLMFGGGIIGYEVSAARRARARATDRPAVAWGLVPHSEGGGTLALSGSW